MRNDLVADNTVSEVKIIRKLEPMHVVGIINITIPTPHEMMRMIFGEVQDLRSSIEIQKQKIDILINKMSERNYRHDKNIITWAPLSIISSMIGLTKDAVRKQLQNGDFEEGVDFKREGNKIVVHQEAIARLHRKRRSSNG